MNPDIPGLEACKRLAKAGWTVATFFRYEKEIEEIGEWRLRQAAGRWRPAYAYVVVDAPTIGEMLAEIRRRGWQVSLSTVGYGSAENRFKATVWRLDKGECARRRIILGHAVADEPADALALALAEAMEKEGKA